MVIWDSSNISANHKNQYESGINGPKNWAAEPEAPMLTLSWEVSSSNCMMENGC